MGSKKLDVSVTEIKSKYEIEFALKVGKKLKKIQIKDRQKITKAIELLKHNPTPKGCKKIKEFTKVYRIRIGDYRVIYKIKQDQLIILVLEIGDRKEIYERLKQKLKEKLK